MNINQEHLNYNSIVEKYNWIISKHQKCIISPDIDGILCGLLMSHYFDWNISGYYDGKTLAIDEQTHLNECIFLDMEIYRNNIRSIGQHMLMYNKKNLPDNWFNFENSINPNNIRGFDSLNSFKNKYPFGTIHLLISIIYSAHQNIQINKKAVSILLYVDGTFKNLLNYPENCIDWLYYLRAKDSKHPLSGLLNIFAIQRISDIMHKMKDIFRKFNNIANEQSNKGDKIILKNIESDGFTKKETDKINALINFMSDLTEWKYNPNKWNFRNLKTFSFDKGIENKLNGKKYIQLLNAKPLSFAITAAKRIEFTKASDLIKC